MKGVMRDRTFDSFDALLAFGENGDFHHAPIIFAVMTVDILECAQLVDNRGDVGHRDSRVF